MTDRELLELAAKAAGIEGTYREHEWFPGIVEPVIGGGDQPWNPLISDQQALRLAVKLRIGVHFNVYRKEDCAIAGSDGSYQEQKLCDDPCAATRRAIVRAAAEIGRMKND